MTHYNVFGEPSLDRKFVTERYGFPQGPKALGSSPDFQANSRGLISPQRTQSLVHGHIEGRTKRRKKSTDRLIAHDPSEASVRVFEAVFHPTGACASQFFKLGHSRFRFFEATTGAASSKEMSIFSSPGHFSLPIDLRKGRPYINCFINYEV